MLPDGGEEDVENEFALFRENVIVRITAANGSGIVLADERHGGGIEVFDDAIEVGDGDELEEWRRG